MDAVDKETQELELAEQATKERIESLMQMADQELSKLLLKRMLVTLVANIESGFATASDLNVARALLKDNNIGIIPTRENAAGVLQERLNSYSKKSLEGPNMLPPEKLSEVDISDFIDRVN